MFLSGVAIKSAKYLCVASNHDAHSVLSLNHSVDADGVVSETVRQQCLLSEPSAKTLIQLIAIFTPEN